MGPQRALTNFGGLVFFILILLPPCCEYHPRQSSFQSHVAGTAGEICSGTGCYVYGAQVGR